MLQRLYMIVLRHYVPVYTSTRIILGMGSASERRYYTVKPPLLGGAHTQNDPWTMAVLICGKNMIINNCVSTCVQMHALMYSEFPCDNILYKICEFYFLLLFVSYRLWFHITGHVKQDKLVTTRSRESMRLDPETDHATLLIPTLDLRRRICVSVWNKWFVSISEPVVVSRRSLHILDWVGQMIWTKKEDILI